MGRIRLPVFERIRGGRPPKTLCVATALSPEAVSALDLAAGILGETRAEFIRTAILERMNRK